MAKNYFVRTGFGPGFSSGSGSSGGSSGGSSSLLTSTILSRPPAPTDNSSKGFGLGSYWKNGRNIYKPVVAPTSTDATWGQIQTPGGTPLDVMGATPCQFAGGTIQVGAGLTGPAFTLSVAIGGVQTPTDISILPDGTQDVKAIQKVLALADAGTYGVVTKLFDFSGKNNHATYPAAYAPKLIYDLALGAWVISGDGSTSRILNLPQGVAVTRQSYSAFMYGRATNSGNSNNACQLFTLGDWVGGSVPHVSQEISCIQFVAQGGLVVNSNPTGQNRNPVTPVYAQSDPCIIGVVSSAANVNFFCNEQMSASTSPSQNNAALLGGYIGTDTVSNTVNVPVAGRWLAHHMGSFYVFSSIATAAQIEEIKTGMYSLYPIYPQKRQNNVVCIGDSRTAGTAAFWNGMLAVQAIDRMATPARLIGIGNGGATVTNITAQQGSQAASQYVTGAKNVVVILAGVNDFIVGGGSTVSDVRDRLASLCLIYRNVGFKVLLIAELNCLTATNGANTQLPLLRAAILAAGESGMNCDKIVDVSGLTAINTPSNTLYYPDGLHWGEHAINAAGSLIYPEIDKLLAL